MTTRILTVRTVEEFKQAVQSSCDGDEIQIIYRLAGCNRVEPLKYLLNELTEYMLDDSRVVFDAADVLTEAIKLMNTESPSEETVNLVS